MSGYAMSEAQEDPKCKHDRKPSSTSDSSFLSIKRQFLFIHKKDQAGTVNIQQLCRGQCDFGTSALHNRTVFAR